jgi:hypothetical protein
MHSSGPYSHRQLAIQTGMTNPTCIRCETRAEGPASFCDKLPHLFQQQDSAVLYDASNCAAVTTFRTGYGWHLSHINCKPASF